ncbi:MAG: hypothetical protein CVU43_19565 [Chloroflexi bacterium HGW-Chloroflexi-5]|nr:MAG: hypothetical protein CVU43_19565 [Chloroflexi bacterium HGW-Chloroflexi-5]
MPLNHFAKIGLPATAGNNSLQGFSDRFLQLKQDFRRLFPPFPPDFLREMLRRRPGENLYSKCCLGFFSTLTIIKMYCCVQHKSGNI